MSGQFRDFPVVPDKDVMSDYWYNQRYDAMYYALHGKTNPDDRPDAGDPATFCTECRHMDIVHIADPDGSEHVYCAIHKKTCQNAQFVELEQLSYHIV